MTGKLTELIHLINTFQEQHIGFKSLNDAIDTTTAHGRLVFNLFASLAEFERDLIRERTRAGLASARARGRQGGRPKGLSPEAQSKAQAARTLFEQQEKTAQEIGQLLGVSRATIYRWLKEPSPAKAKRQSPREEPLRSNPKGGWLIVGKKVYAVQEDGTLKRLRFSKKSPTIKE
ncbi:recombinase family protein [Larkinella soli]|uniref:recombinase family protein n=1 Tax=Larkinella soli TaxID=1770527 RepID=UPI000FFC88A4|nr:recombinase family protein [Larkinella soli]